MRSALDVLEAATGLLRAARASDHLYYVLGTLPFVWSFVWFWAEMSRSGNAARHLGQSVCSLCAAYVWMRIAQTLFVQRLLLVLREDSRTWSLRELGKMAIHAAVIQTSALPVTCFAACLLIPTAWTVAFYHHAQTSTAPERSDVFATLRSALADSQRWPRQNHTMLSLHAAFGGVVFLNVWVLLLVSPQLLHSLFGFETRLLIADLPPFNTTLLAVAFALTWALVDPFLKAAYAVRAFRADAITTGRDLSVSWRRAVRTRFAGTALLALVFLGAFTRSVAAEEMEPASGASDPPAAAAPLEPSEPSDPGDPGNPGDPVSDLIEEDRDDDRPVNASSPPVGSEGKKLDAKLQDVLERPAFAFREPRRSIEEPEEAPSWLQTWLSETFSSLWDGMGKVFEWALRAIRWLFGLGDHSGAPRPAGDSGIGKWSDRALVLLAILVVLLPLIPLVKLLLRKRPVRAVVVPAVAEVAGTSEGAEAAKRPAAEWNAQAEELLRRGERRLALRALFLSNLAKLIHAGHIVASPHKSVGDYRRDLERRAHAHPNLYRGYCGMALIFEAVWYGNHPVTDESLARFSSHSELLTQDV
jgi:hypothetical protein